MPLTSDVGRLWLGDVGWVSERRLRFLKWNRILLLEMMCGFYFVGDCCICKFWKEIVLVHGSECVSDIIDAVWSFTQHCNPLRRPLPKHLQYDRGIPISTYWLDISRPLFVYTPAMTNHGGLRRDEIEIVRSFGKLAFACCGVLSCKLQLYPQTN